MNTIIQAASINKVGLRKDELLFISSLNHVFGRYLNAAANASNITLPFPLPDQLADYDQLSEDYKKMADKGPANGKQLGDFLINHKCRGKRKGMALLNFDDFVNFAKLIDKGGAGYGNAIGAYGETLGVNKPTRAWLFNNGEKDPPSIVVDDTEAMAGTQTEIDGQAFAGELAKAMNSTGNFSKKDFLTYMLKFQ